MFRLWTSKPLLLIGLKRAGVSRLIEDLEAKQDSSR